ncbi:hypothetical protein MKK69_02900 [Methylobacterium sp. J-026]|uniref:hypothetical protein n=1 Tax=Methylobacterium sp. J-026 TaxID=2836624 RepID=UPI001FBBC1DE|nr:hypothetical protein [Methylobacterium sp. J-026]MCJ2133023.1 hypothetical protein [Methylobacterium sp. J-026]
MPAALLAAAMPAAAARAQDSPAWPEPDGTLVLARPFGRSEIALRLSRRVAGAADTLTWNGVAFLADAGVGDALQARLTLDPEADGRQASEAGDPRGEPAAARVRSLRAGRSWAETVAPLAWDGPGAAAGPDVILHKRIALGLPGLGNAIEVQAGFVLSRPAAAVRFEPLSATVPAEFTEAWRFDPATGGLDRLDSAPGERPQPVILALPEGSHALGIWSPAPPAGEADAPRAGFAIRPVPGATRLSCVFRVAQAASGAHDFACYALVGSLTDVRAALRSLTAPE